MLAGLLGIQNYTFSFFTVMPTRKQVFNDQFLAEKITKMHQFELGHDAQTPALGYPDMGAGRYAKLLPYGDWFRFNCAQRIHANSVEHLAWTIPIMLVGGIIMPRLSIAAGLVVIVGRELYRYGYMTNDGPNSFIRELGSYPLNIAEGSLMLGIGFFALRYFFGPFFNNRRFVKRFKLSAFDIKYAEVLRKIKDGRAV